MIPNIFDAELPMLEYSDEQNLDEVHEAFARTLRQGPIALGPYGHEVLGYDVVRTALRDTRFAIPPAPGLTLNGITSGPIWDRVSKVLLSLDGAEHQRQRRLLATAFTRSAAERLRAKCIEVINELLEQPLADGRCEVVNDLARTYPTALVCSVIHAPRQDWDRLSGLVDHVSEALGIRVAGQEEAILRAWTELEAYLGNLIDERRRSLSDDLVSDMIRAEADGDRLTQTELIYLTMALFLAGVDTTRNQLAGAVYVLAKHPDQWALLGNRPELAPQAVEEVMRHSPTILRVLRRAVVDVELGGVRFPAGWLTLVTIGAANRDPAVYEEPARFDITRNGAPAVMSFGGGVHYCLGVHLARVALAEALRAITATMTHPRIAGPVPWKSVHGPTGPVTLPIEFTSSARAIT